MIHKRIYFVIREQDRKSYIPDKFSLKKCEAIAVGSFKVGEVAIIVPQHLWVQRIKQAEYGTYQALELLPEYMNSDNYNDNYMWLPHPVDGELDVYARIPSPSGSMTTHVMRSLELCGLRLCTKTHTLTEA